MEAIFLQTPYGLFVLAGGVVGNVAKFQQLFVE